MISVSNILKELSSQSLMYWANKIGLEGVKLSDYYRDSTKKGINKHDELQKEFLEKGYKDYETVGIEVEINNGDICGRIDFIAEKGDSIFIFDIKSSNSIYLSHVLQLLAYKSIYKKVFGIEPKIGIINIETREETILELDETKYYKILNSLYTIATTRDSLEYR